MTFKHMIGASILKWFFYKPRENVWMWPSFTTLIFLFLKEIGFFDWSLILHYLSDQCSVLQGVCDILSIPCSPRVLVDPTVWKFSAQLPRCKTPPLPILHTWSSVRPSGGSNGKPDRWCQDNGGRVQQVEESCVVATLRFFCILWSMFWVEGLTCERLTPKKNEIVLFICLNARYLIHGIFGVWICLDFI